MMSETWVAAWRDDLERNLAEWSEPRGMLVPTEPDPEEREACRGRLRVAIEVLGRVLER
jgi:hypothetical protein